MAKSKQDKLIDEWVAFKNSRTGQIIIPNVGEYPIDMDNWYGSQMNEYVTTDLIRHYVDSIGDRNPLYRFQDYARKTRWGGIIAPPTFTDAIVQPYPSKIEPELTDKFDHFWNVPYGSRREFFQVIRPGDKLRVIQRPLGVKEIESKRGKDVREFHEITRRTLINQREEVVANSDVVLNVVIEYPVDEKHPFWPGRKKYKLTDKERDDIERGYDEEKRRGANTLFWEDVSVGEKFKLHDVGPMALYDVAAFYAGAIVGHAVAFDCEHERINHYRSFHYLDPEVNAWTCSGICHFIDNKGHAPIWTGGPAVGLYSQDEGLIARLICDWMGDDGFIKRLDCNTPSYPILGDVFRLRGKVTEKCTTNNGEHLVDVEVRCENAHDGMLITEGTSTVRLASRTDNKG
jgi:acyl dehydratase